MPVFDEAKCVGCGACAERCPKGIISIMTMPKRLLHLNIIDECLAPCAQRCPAQIDIPGYIEAIEKKDYQSAIRILKDRNPLIIVCGKSDQLTGGTRIRRYNGLGIIDPPS